MRTKDVLDPEKLWKDFTFHIDYAKYTVIVCFRGHVWHVFSMLLLDRQGGDTLITDEILRWLRRTDRTRDYMMHVPVYEPISGPITWENEPPPEADDPPSRDKTLGDYHDLAVALYGAESPQAAFFDKKIQEQGADEIVIADESQMLYLLSAL